MHDKVKLRTNFNQEGKIKFTQEIVDEIYDQLSFAEKYTVDEYGAVWEKDPVGAVRSALQKAKLSLDPAWFSWGTRAAKISTYKSFVSDIKSISTENGIEELSTTQRIEQSLLEDLDEKTIKSLQTIESPNDVVKLWYLEYLITRKSSTEISSEIKDLVKQRITDIIFDNSYGIDFISSLMGETSYFTPQYELLKSTYFACLSYTLLQDQNPNAPPQYLSFDQFQKLLQSKITKSDAKLSTLKSILSDGINPQEKTVLGIRDAMLTMLKELRYNNREEIMFVQKALDEIWSYREKKLQDDSNAYDELFYNFYVIAYHLGTLIPRSVGFDIKFFVPLSDDIFVAGPKDLKYQRHHFRALFASVRKGSMDIKDLILTDAKLHKSYESYVKTQEGEDKMQKLLNDFQTLMTMKKMVKSQGMI